MNSLKLFSSQLICYTNKYTSLNALKSSIVSMACQENYVVDIVEGQHQKCWISSIQDQVKNYSRDEADKKFKKTSIYRLPTFAKNKKEKAFTPQVASFGPFHHGNPNLKRIEDYKRHVLVHFLNKGHVPLQSFVDAIEEVVEELQGSYHGLEEQWTRDIDKFIKLMVMDGCFMLELLRLDQKNGDQTYPDHDPIFSFHGAHNKMPYIKRDMLMLENQLPLKVLKVLIDVEAGQAGARTTEKYINQLVHKFYWGNSKCETEKLGLHVLDVYRQNMIKTIDTTRSPSSQLNGSNNDQGGVFTATKLRERGVRFKKSKTNKIEFNKATGVLELPSIEIDDSAECKFLNLMAFEHLHVGEGNEITSYICFMDELIDSASDVHLLSEKGIIVNAVGSEEAVAEIVNSLTREVISDPRGELKVARENLKDYSHKKINMWKASLKHTHFSNPWSVTALFAATLLLVLTVIQTVYTGLGYHHQPNNSTTHRQ